MSDTTAAPDHAPAAEDLDDAAFYPAPVLPSETSPPSPTGPARRTRRLRMAAMFAVAALLGAGSALAVSELLRDDPAPVATETVIDRVETRVVTPDDRTVLVAAVAQQVLPSIVTVEVSELEGGAFTVDTSGSGIVYDDDGHLITNAHVVDEAARVRVVFADGRIYPALIVGFDVRTDVAVLRVEAIGVTPIELGTSTGLEIGDTAIAVGSPLGLLGGPSVTTGVVSAFDRRVRTEGDSELFGMLQTDAPITRGSSGGALVDASGRLIGVTTAIAVSDVGAEGLGFAIPVELVDRVARDIISTGATRHAFLGISGSTYFEDLPDGGVAPAGVEVAEIIPGTAAEAGGLQPGDVLLTFDGEPLVTLDGLIVRLRFYRVGDSVTLEVRRGGSTVDVPLVLMERPEDL